MYLKTGDEVISYKELVDMKRNYLFKVWVSRKCERLTPKEIRQLDKLFHPFYAWAYWDGTASYEKTCFTEDELKAAFVQFRGCVEGIKKLEFEGELIIQYNFAVHRSRSFLTFKQK